RLRRALERGFMAWLAGEETEKKKDAVVKTTGLAAARWLVSDTWRIAAAGVAETGGGGGFVPPPTSPQLSNRSNAGMDGLSTVGVVGSNPAAAVAPPPVGTIVGGGGGGSVVSAASGNSSGGGGGGASSSAPVVRQCAICGGVAGPGPWLLTLSVDGRMYHLDCFRCAACGQNIAEHFFPLRRPDGGMEFLCEKDYYARLDMLCARCGTPLRFPHVSLAGRHFHLEHFGCTPCGNGLNETELYYERDGDVYCQFHYSQLLANRCGGCRTAVLKKYVEVANKYNVVEQWHPECYTVDKVGGGGWGAERRRQQVTQEKVMRIHDVLTTFEDSFAESVVGMVDHFSKSLYQEGVIDALRFLSHVNAIFAGLDGILAVHARSGREFRMKSRKTPRLLVRKVIGVFTMLAASRDAPQKKEFPKMLTTSVKELGNMMKPLIRSALNGALGLEQKYDSEVAVYDLLDQLLANADPIDLLESYHLDQLDGNVRADLCAVCERPVEASCFKFGTICWHGSCFKCYTCDRELRYDAAADARLDQVSCAVFCPAHAPADAVGGVAELSQLQLYLYLLILALKRLATLLNVS
ncbi:hypothetical protein HK405_011549, partial [Cladochytrium tenue]